MGFVQIIEITTSRFDEIEALHEAWLADTEGERTTLSETICRDRDRPDTYLVIVEFPSHEAAMRNNELPATEKIAAGMAELADQPPTFRDLDLVRHD
jgi:quinol monooxygenase YgiN